MNRIGCARAVAAVGSMVAVASLLLYQRLKQEPRPADTQTTTVYVGRTLVDCTKINRDEMASLYEISIYEPGRSNRVKIETSYEPKVTLYGDSTASTYNFTTMEFEQ